MNIVKYKWVWFSVSILIILPGIISLFLWGLSLGIDFTGGSIIEISGTSNSERVLEILKEEEVENPTLSLREDEVIIIRSKQLEEEKHRQVVKRLADDLNVSENRFETVGASVSSDLTNKAFYSIAIASIFIIIYLAFSFRKVPKPINSWQFGVCAVLALIHDVLIMLGIFSILGHFFGIEVDSMFVTAALTIIGFSVHDTIVVFDRIRENLIRKGSEDFKALANDSIIQTLVRSINTSFSTLLVLLALYLLGGETIKTFVLALLIGIVAGTYSSIFVATPLLVVWHDWKERKQEVISR